MEKRENLITYKYTTMQKEFVRKGIHMTIALIPTLSSLNKNFTILLLIVGTIFYILNEILRNNGIIVFSMISSVSEIAARDRDKGITLGPVTLAIGAILSLSIFSPVAATCGIYALAFGDGLSSITGKLWGYKKIPYTKGKSYTGFFTCFTMILSTTYGVTGSFSKSLMAAIAGSIIELVPAKDVDNLLIPVTVAIVVTLTP